MKKLLMLVLEELENQGSLSRLSKGYGASHPHTAGHTRVYGPDPTSEEAELDDDDINNLDDEKINISKAFQKEEDMYDQ